MTGTISGTDSIGTAEPTDDGVVAVSRFEACAEHQGPDADAPCRECGWLVDEHTAGLAPVIPVIRPAVTTPLRRAS